MVFREDEQRRRAAENFAPVRKKDYLISLLKF
jgi:hypothetical protein